MAKINEGVIVLSVPQSGMMIKKIPSKFCIEVYFFQLSKCLPVPLIDFFVIISSVDRFDRQSSMPYFLYENYGSFPVGYSQLPDFGPAVADRRGNPPTKGQRVS